jgi:hypothetical protein
LVAPLAAATALGIAWLHGLSVGLTVAFVGLSSGLASASALAVRARRSIRVLTRAYLELDRGLFESEQTRERLSIAIGELAGANVQLRAMSIAFAELLNLANERSNGRMRALIEETGAELAEILAQHLSSAQRVHD